MLVVSSLSDCLLLTSIFLLAVIFLLLNYLLLSFFRPKCHFLDFSHSPHSPFHIPTPWTAEAGLGPIDYNLGVSDPRVKETNRFSYTSDFG